MNKHAELVHRATDFSETKRLRGTRKQWEKILHRAAREHDVTGTIRAQEQLDSIDERISRQSQSKTANRSSVAQPSVIRVCIRFEGEEPHAHTPEEALWWAIEQLGWRVGLRMVLHEMPDTEQAQKEFLEELRQKFADDDKGETDRCNHSGRQR